MSRSAPSDRIERMLAGVREAGLKLTPQRMAIVKELAGDETHPTAQELFERLRPALPDHVVRDRLQHARRALVGGACAAMSLSPGSGRFDPNMAPHHHVVCDALRRRSRSVPSSEAEKGAADPARARAVAKVLPGFEVRSVEQIFRGICASCAKGRPVSPKGRRRAAKGA